MYDVEGRERVRHTLVGVFVERVDVRGLDDARAALDNASGLAEVASGLLVAGEVASSTYAEGLVGGICDL